MTLLLLILIFVSILSLKGQTNLPSKAIFRPKFLSGFDYTREQWETKIKNQDWGTQGSGYWIVYSDRANNYTYTTPGGVTRFDTLKFKERVFIARISTGYALIYQETSPDTKSLSISPNAKSKGWIKLDNLLLWNSCPVDAYKIYDKGVVVNNLNTLDSSQYIEISPEFQQDPELKITATVKALKLEFYFIYKEVGNALLIGKESLITGSNSENSVIQGWIGAQHIARWNQRSCLEPVNGENNINLSQQANVRPAIFLEESQAIVYKDSGKMDRAYIKPVIELQRMSPYSFRFPILSTTHEFVHNVVTIGNMGQQKVTEKDKAEAKKKYEELTNRQSKINIVFVVDATTSMQQYYQPIVRALLDTNLIKMNEHQKIRFGAVAYRDYVDGEKVAEYVKLTDQIAPVKTFLENTVAKSHPDDKDLPEALYKGMEKALSDQMGFNKDESNFIILVGDCGNHPQDPTGLTLDQIVNKLDTFSVNMIAFQANNRKSEPSYSQFITQVQDMIRKTITWSLGTAVRFDQVRSGYRESVAVGRNRQKIIVGGYSYCAPDQSQVPDSLDKLVKRKFVDFNNQVTDWLVVLNNLLNVGHNTAVWTDEIIQWLKKKGFNDAQIKILQGEEIKVNGYTSAKILNPPLTVFDYTIFMSKVDYDLLIKNLRIINIPITTNRKRDFINALSSLALSYTGSFNAENVMDYSVDDIMKVILGIPKVNNSLKINLKEIPTLPQPTFNKYILDLQQKLSELEQIQFDEHYYFKSNGHIYYWIPLSEMP